MDALNLSNEAVGSEWTVKQVTATGFFYNAAVFRDIYVLNPKIYLLQKLWNMSHENLLLLHCCCTHTKLQLATVRGTLKSTW